MPDKTENTSAINETVDDKLVGLFYGLPFHEVTDNISEQDLETLYAVAHSHYVAKNYKDAETLFKYLNLMNTFDSRFSMGLAGCFQALEKYEEAIKMYQCAMMATALKDPTPMFFTALCYVKTNQVSEAIKALELTIHYAKSDRYSDILKQAKDLLEILTIDNEA